ncbi:MAG: PHP domain-containing protein [Candidatus Lokiarchaeota archaeon]|nr:PHP domain-containing protein [Candidatus Lokiarchaeota archaeon]
MSRTDAPAPQDYHIHTIHSDGESTPISMVRACASAGCKEIAITDHVDQHGSFVFVPEFRKTTDLRSYIEEIGMLADRVMGELGVAVHAGIELCTTSHEYKAAFREHVARYCDALDIILVEGRDDAGAVNVAIMAREVLRDLGQAAMPIVISHPDFATIVKDIDAIVRNGIGLELNESKLSPAHKNGLDAVLEEARSLGIPSPRFTLGSDAHVATEAGRLPLACQHARARGLLDRLIWL